MVWVDPNPCILRELIIEWENAAEEARAAVGPDVSHLVDLELDREWQASPELRKRFGSRAEFKAYRLDIFRADMVHRDYGALVQ